MASEPTRHLLLFPYLPLNRPVDIGRWQLLPLADFHGPWAEPWFQQRSLDVASRHVDRDGSPVPKPSVLVDRTAGADGVLPTDDEMSALVAAVGFGVIDVVPVPHSPLERSAMAHHQAAVTGQNETEILRQLDETAENQWAYTQAVATADNAEPFFWPIGPDGDITRQYGSIVKTRMIGSGGGLAGKVVAPNELHLPLGVTLDEERVAGLYDFLTTGEATIVASIRESIRWLLQSWRNTPSLLPVQRIVLLRTAFEVLLSKTPQEKVSKERLARRLSGVFFSLSRNDRRAVTPGTLLWQPTQRFQLHLDKVSKSLAPYSRLEQWFIELSNARNDIVHSGTLDRVQFQDSRSVFAGDFWRVGTRVLQEAILVRLDTLGYPGLWQASSYRQMLRALREAQEVSSAAG